MTMHRTAAARVLYARSPTAGVLFLLGVGVFLLCTVSANQPAVHAQQGDSLEINRRGLARKDYAGDSACLRCHKGLAESYQQTSHHLSSQVPSAASILGSFQEGNNTLMISNPRFTDLDPRLYFKMESLFGEFRQTAVAQMGSKVLTHSELMDIVIGSGRRGQTYLYWKGEQLFELPVSYWSENHQWINSPGYKDGTANFDRHVDSRCLECHVTYIQPLSADPQSNVYDRKTLVAGISCETCHGPGADHASRPKAEARSAPGAPKIDIVNPEKLSRDRQIDQCALCHNGTRSVERQPAFTYRPGEPLEEFLTPNPADLSDHPDVHGNQVGLLRKSRCFLSSPSMSCSTCHDVHRPERASSAYSDRCLTCHQLQSLEASHKSGLSLKKNCIDCHMPLQQTEAIVSETADHVLRTSIRTHWIAIY